MLGAGLGLLVALIYGSADFFGGLASRRRATSAVVLWSQITGLLVLLVVVPFLGGAPTGRDLGLGAAAGLAGLCGLLLLYRGLAVGRMSVVAPITAVGAAFVPFVVGVTTGDGLPVARLGGAALALIGVVLVSQTPEAGPSSAVVGFRASLGPAVGAGAAFGIVFVLISAVGEKAGLWPILVQKLAAVLAILLAGVVAGLPRRVARIDLRLILPAGLCDAAANVLFLLAARAGALSVVGVISSLYPASTVLLAASVLKERVTAAQGVGLALAASGVVLLAL